MRRSGHITGRSGRPTGATGYRFRSGTSEGHGAMSSIRRYLFPALVLAAATPGVAAAQERLLPRVRSFELPEASPRVHGLLGRLISARRGRQRVRPGAGSRGGTRREFSRACAAPRARARFRSASARRCTAVSAWAIRRARSSATTGSSGLNTTAELGHWSLTAEILHESSHLGDEYGDRFDAEPARLDPRGRVGMGELLDRSVEGHRQGQLCADR